MSDDSDAVLVEHADAAELQSSNPKTTVPSKTEGKGDDTGTEEKEEMTKATTDEDQAKEEKTPAAADTPEALQIVSIGTEENAYAFAFHEDALNTILSKIPVGWKVAVVSVVGAFRTGKSFLLSWFLRYLHTLDSNTPSSSEKKWYETIDSLGHSAGFHWRGGAERNTTGIWMWSEPHFVKKKSGEQVAILLVDTQGMFDHETTMSLTASIFGLGTLFSSYLIYNVDKRIQEDNLQQLALFSEYARMAMVDDGDPTTVEATSKPFQHIEFLVRDWQHFEEEDGDYAAMEKEMEKYLEDVIADRDAKDLKQTREQILSCFEKISCYGFVHPGMAVTKKKYNGEVSMMDEDFLHLLDRYCTKVFDVETLAPKIIHDREITAVELGSYIKAYATLFDKGAKFPEAATLLEATATANNTNAVQLSMMEYKHQMDRIAGPTCSNYVRPEELKEIHREIIQQSLEQFKSVANFGNKGDIDVAREKLLSSIGESFVVYESLNESRNPLGGLEIYFLPAVIAFTSYLLRFLADNTCSSWSTYCKRSSDFFSHVFAVVFCFLLIIAATKAKQINDLLQRIKKAVQLIMSESNGSSSSEKTKKD